MKKMYQCKLQCGNKILITWLPEDKPFKVGDFITLKDSEEPLVKWKVITKGDAQEASDIKRGWNNNI